MLSATQTVTGRRVRLPINLLFSAHHTHLSVYVYALLDVLGGRPGRRTGYGPAEASRRWLAGRCGVSESGMAKTLSTLTREHAEHGAVPGCPAYVISHQRGRKMTALRHTVAGVPYVDLPEWTLGDEHTGPLVEHAAWRLYAAYLWLRHPDHGTVAHPRRELAKLIRVRPDTIPRLLRQLVAARLVAVHERPGRETLVMPLARRDVTDAEITALWEQVPACGQDTPKRSAACGQPAEPHPPTGTAPHPPTGTAPHPPTGTATEDPHYRGPHYEDPAPAAAPAAPGHGTATAPAARLPWQLREATGRQAVAALRAFLDDRKATRQAMTPDSAHRAARHPQRAAA